MQSAQEESTLAGVRHRGQGYLGYLLWALAILGLLWTLNAVASLVERWIAILDVLRRSAGIPAPATGPDYWTLFGVGALVVVFLALSLAAYAMYRRSWTRGLHAAWNGHPDPQLTRIRPLRGVAGPGELEARCAYLAALDPAQPAPDSRAAYEAAAAAKLREIETAIAHRAVTAGLVIGLNRNALLDSLTILASALELQLYVLTRLGKRPSLRTWMELARRTGASLFLNSYVTREDALYLNLAIRKAALGLEVASDAVQSALADIDFDEVMGHVEIPGLAQAAQLASLTVSVGASGLRQIGNFIEHAANDLLQGVLAGGVLYYHGMALAAECLSLDEQHRRSHEMTRTVSQAMTVACAPAGRLLRDQVRRMREFLRERRKLILSAAKDKAREGSGRVWDSVKGWTGFSTRATASPPSAAPPDSK